MEGTLFIGRVHLEIEELKMGKNDGRKIQINRLANLFVNDTSAYLWFGKDDLT